MTNLVAAGPAAAAMVPFQELERMAHAVAKSGLFGIKTPEQAVALMLIAQAEGRHPAIVARDYDIIQGRPAKKAEAMLRDFLSAGGTVKWHKLDATIADATFSHPQGGEVRITWTMEQAEKANLASKATWKQYPRQMLRSRCVSEGCRTVCPQSTSGMYDTEEVRDFTPEPAEDRRKDRQPRDVSPAEAFTGAPAAHPEIGNTTKTPQADALLPPQPPKAPVDEDDWKQERARKLNFRDRNDHAAAVMSFIQDQRGFSITDEWVAKEIEHMTEGTKKSKWHLNVDELAELHQKLRDAGDAGERFKKPNGSAPPEFAPLPDDGVPF